MTNWGILGLGRMGLSFIEAINDLTNTKLISIIMLNKIEHNINIYIYIYIYTQI